VKGATAERNGGKGKANSIAPSNARGAKHLLKISAFN